MRTLYSGLGLAAGLLAASPASAQGTLILDDTPRSWQQAEAYAVSLGGHLVTIDDAAENQAVLDLLGGASAWVGLNDIASEGDFVWSSGAPVTFSDWDVNQPDDFNGNEDCTQLNGPFTPNGWNDAPCSVELASVIELSTRLVYDDQSRTWEDAQAYAESLGGNLASIASAGENEAVRRFVVENGAGSAWIGFSDIASEGDFVWSDGSPTTYTNWDGTEPNDAGGEDCTEFYNSGVWNDARCAFQSGGILRTAVIEVPVDSPRVLGSLNYGDCPSNLPTGRFACRVDVTGTFNGDRGQRYTFFLRVTDGESYSRIAFRGEVKPAAGQTVEQSVKFKTVGADPAEFALEMVVEEGSVVAPSGDALVLDALDFFKGAVPLLRQHEALSTFPNPATSQATLRFALAEAAEATLVVYDALGREVARPVEGRVEGAIEARVDASGLAPGVYVARLAAGERVEAVRLTVVR